jgi:hypothetical protein
MIELDSLLARQPGADVVMALTGIDLSVLSPADAVSLALLVERQIGWLSAVQDEAILAAASPTVQVLEVFTLAGPPDHGVDRIRLEDGIREELATALHWSTGHAHDRLTRARYLAGPLARTHDALAAGTIAPAHVQVIVAHATRLPGGIAVLAGDATDGQRAAFTAACARLQDHVLPVAARGAPARAKAAAQRAVLAIDAAGQARRRANATVHRDAFVFAEDDGLSVLAVRMATEAAHACLAAIDSLAHDDRFPSDCAATIGERRALAAAAMILDTGSGCEGAGGGRSGHRNRVPEPRLRAQLDITIDLDTLLSMQADAGNGAAACDDGADAARGGGGWAELAGAGPVAADVVRDLLADPDVAVTMRRLVTDPITGHLLDLGRTRYRVPYRLREFLTIRDATCRFPGCTRKATRCQIDHARAWNDGGHTNPGNLGPLCLRHHQLKTHGGWTITSSHADGSCVWTSPHGRDHPHEAKRLTAKQHRDNEADTRWREKWGLPSTATDAVSAGDDPPF